MSTLEYGLYLIDNPPAKALAPTLVLAHGAGAPMDSDFMQIMAELLAARGVRVVRFEFPYMQERRQSGKRRPPNRQPELLQTWREALADCRTQFQDQAMPLFIGGKSMGGRMASLIADEESVDGLVCLGYPFHPQGKPEKLRTEHLEALQTPTLVVQGTRDALGNREEVKGYTLSAQIELLWLEDGDHDLKPRVRSGCTHAQHLETAATAIAAFMKA